MLEAKVDCIKNPNREAPRDIYDLFLLINMNVRPTLEALKAYGDEVLAEMKQSVWDKLEKMDFDVAKEKLITFMPPHAAKKITSEVWEEMRIAVGASIESWIDEARSSTGIPNDNSDTEYGHAENNLRFA